MFAAQKRRWIKGKVRRHVVRQKENRCRRHCYCRFLRFLATIFRSQSTSLAHTRDTLHAVRTRCCCSLLFFFFHFYYVYPRPSFLRFFKWRHVHIFMAILLLCAKIYTMSVTTNLKLWRVVMRVCWRCICVCMENGIIFVVIIRHTHALAAAYARPNMNFLLNLCWCFFWEINKEKEKMKQHSGKPNSLQCTADTKKKNFVQLFI